MLNRYTPLKRTPIKRKSKKMDAWARARKILKVIYFEKEITHCELNLEGCTYDNFLSFAHRYKRTDPRCEHTFEQTLLACTNCHQKIEYDKDLTEHVFENLR